MQVFSESLWQKVWASSAPAVRHRRLCDVFLYVCYSRHCVCIITITIISAISTGDDSYCPKHAPHRLEVTLGRTPGARWTHPAYYRDRCCIQIRTSVRRFSYHTHWNQFAYVFLIRDHFRAGSMQQCTGGVLLYLY
ncbi:hypothetical protein AALO_G00231690 [Alosa alosa]|uniref:Uncharacterized protein n=1 Tax=Alosa alosa TaxID=278164 RepID=A0AAV6FYB6_9TELE|nr:hypothetical protein AALO_G00231690 [Alosa alosa]